MSYYIILYYITLTSNSASSEGLLFAPSAPRTRPDMFLHVDLDMIISLVYYLISI